jgi:hypothetical protein
MTEQIQKRPAISKASQAFKDMILASYRHIVVKYKCGTIIEYPDVDHVRETCPICCANQDILKITFLEGQRNDYGYKGEIYPDGKYE